MELRVSREDLLVELTLLSGIVERRTTIPILSHLLLDAREDRLHLAATDLDVSLSTNCDAEVRGDGSLAVQAKKLTEIVRALPEGQIELVVESGHDITIRAGRSRFRIRGLEADSFPTLPDVGGEGAAEIPLALLKRMIAKVLFAISTEESRFQLNGALLKVKEGGLEMVATDGHRLALVELRVAEGEGEGLVVSAPAAAGVLVPRKALQEILRFDGDGPVAFRRGEHHLAFGIGRRQLTCRILEGTFPDYDRVIARDQPEKPVLERQQFQQAVSRVALLTGERARGVLLQFGEGSLTVSAANPDLGEASEQVPCTYDGKDLELGLNPDYLGQFLSALDSDRVRLELADSESQCVGYPEGEEGMRYLCVIMPMHV